jgi:VanZ family protein
VAPDRRRARRAAAIAALGWAAVLLYLGSRPGESLPGKDLLAVPGADKICHAAAYGILGALFAYALGPCSLPRALLLGAIAGALWGTLDEGVQGHVPGRTPSWADLLADSVGAACGGLLAGSRRRSIPRAPSATMPDPLSRGDGT